MNKAIRDKSFFNILFLQMVVIIYTMATVVSKFASSKEFMSFAFLALYALEILFLGVYAVLWQQVIKGLAISVAYANRSIALLWSLVWATLFFGESISFQNLIGVLVVIIGTVVINSDE